MGKKGKSARRARGTGSLFHDARRGVWVYRKFLGRNAEGKPRFLTRSHASQAELVKLVDSLRPPGPRTTVAEWANRWLAGLDVRGKTKDGYTLSVRDYVIPSLGSVTVASLTPHQIEQAARTWATKYTVSKRTGEKVYLKTNTIKLTLAHLHTCLASAVRAGLIPANPASSARKPKGEKTRIDPFTPEELARIIAEGSKRPNTRMHAFLAGTGARAGEALALQVTDYDVSTGMVSITKGWTPKTPAGPPKSPNSVRTIRVPVSAREAVQLAIAGRTSGRLFPHAGHSSAYGPWKRLLAGLGLRSRKCHNLRHGVASAMIAAGEPVAEVAKYLGDTVSTVVKFYCHPTNRDPSLAMDRLLGGGKGRE